MGLGIQLQVVAAAQKWCVSGSFLYHLVSVEQVIVNLAVAADGHLEQVLYLGWAAAASEERGLGFQLQVVAAAQ